MIRRSFLSFLSVAPVKAAVVQSEALLEHDSSAIGDNEQRALVSPESENEIPTAEADDLCHSAQDTETLSPKLDRRLPRSWGVETGRATA